MADFDIPPGGVRLVRETRGESREEFAEEIGVTRGTIGNWERGDSRPRGEYHDEIESAIPAELSLEEVRDAEGRFADSDDPRAHGNEQRLFGSKWLQALRDEPLVAEELGDERGITVLTDKQRMFVERLDLPGVSGDSHRGDGSVTKIYYLPGDERRAVRRFIEENESFVRSQLQHKSNRLNYDWDDWLYSLLEEEFRFRLHE